MGERENESPYEKSIRIIYVYLGVCVCVYVWPKCKANEAMSEVYVYTNINTTRQAGFCVCVCVCVCMGMYPYTRAHVCGVFGYCDGSVPSTTLRARMAGLRRGDDDAHMLCMQTRTSYSLSWWFIFSLSSAP